jgi:hypothetical protein
MTDNEVTKPVNVESTNSTIADSIKPVTEQSPATIKVDLNGKSYDVPIELGKEIIAIRQETKKSRDAIEVAEKKAIAETEKNKLLELMKAQDIDSIKNEISKEYISKIKKYESAIFTSEIKSLLAAEGTLPSAIADAAQLAMSDISISLSNENKVLMADKPADEYIKEWIKSRPHLVAVKKIEAKVGTKPATPPRDSGFAKFSSDIFKK